MNEPINFLFFFIPMIILVGLYFLIVNINMTKQPFGYKVETKIDISIINTIKKSYYRKVLYFSTPIVIIVPVISIFIRSFPLGAILLTSCILLLAIVNFIFYIQAYNKVKTFKY